jgi:hypothetical protein
MKNVFTVHCHDAQCDLSNIPQNLVRCKLFACVHEFLNSLGKVPPVCVLHDNVDVVVLGERFNKGHQSWALQNLEKLRLIFSLLLIFLIQVQQINLLQCILLAIHLVSDERNFTGSSFTERANHFIFGQALHLLFIRVKGNLFHVSN